MDPDWLRQKYCGRCSERNNPDSSKSNLNVFQPMRLSRVINNSAALLVLDLLSKAMPLIVFPFVVRALGPAVYGKIGFATAVAGFFGLVASPGFSTYALREAAKDESRVSFLVRNVLGARVAFAVVSYVLLIVFALTLAPHDFTTRLLIVLSGMVFLVNSVDAQWVFTARSRMWMVTLRGTVGQLVYGGLILALIRRPADSWILPVASVISLLAGTLLIWVPARREYHIPWPVISPEVWRSFLPICMIMGLASMMSMIYDQIDTVMLRYICSEAEVGLYVASYRLMTITMSFTPILGQVFFPLLSETTGQDQENEQRYLGWLGQASIGLALPIATGGFILAEPLTRFALGSQFTGTATLFRWLMLTIVAGPLASYFGSQLIPIAREKKYLAAVAAGAVVNVGLNLFLIPRYGAIAAAFTTAISQAVVAFMNYYFVRDLPRPSLVKATGLSAMASAVMAAGLLLARSRISLHIVVLVLLGALVYAAVYWAGRMLWSRSRT
jgi:O-antigen/teichoic acid export membrane protein